MPISKIDKEFIFSQISPINPKQVNVDRVFTNLLPMLKYDGVPITRASKKRKTITIENLVESVCEEDQLNFKGFCVNRNEVSRWLESDFLSLVYRGNPDKQAIAALSQCT